MAHAKERLSAIPGKWCPYVLGGQGPACNQTPGFDCYECEVYKDGRTDIPLEENLMTENMRMLIFLRNKRDSWLKETEPCYKKAHAYDDPIAELEIRVRKEQRR